MAFPEKPFWERSKVFGYIEKHIAALEALLNFVSVACIMVIMLMAFLEVVGRYFFNRPIPGHLEIVEQFMAAAVFLGIGYTQRLGGHIGVEVLINRLKGRVYHIVEAMNTALALIIYAIITIYASKFALDAFEFGDVTGL